MNKNTITRFGGQVNIVIILIIGIFFSFTSAQAVTTVGANISTDGYLLLNTSAVPPVPVANGTIHYNGTKFRCYENNVWKDCIGATGGPALSSLTDAVAAKILYNGGNAQTWNWSFTDPLDDNKTGIKFGENIASTRTGTSILKASTLSGSSAMPLLVSNIGNGDSFKVEDSSTDMTPFVITNTGQVGIGTSTFDGTNTEKLKVEGVFGSQNTIGAYGDLNKPLYILAKNRNSGPLAATVFAAAADDGVFPSNYLAVGITSSSFNDSTFSIGGPHDGFIFNVGNLTGLQGGNLIVGTMEPGKSIKFVTGGGAAPANESMRINYLGNVGIGIQGLSTVNARLDILPATADALRIEPYNTAAGNTGNLQFMELVANGSNYVGFKAPDNITANKVWTLPNADGTAGFALTTDGAGNLVWSNAVSQFQRVGTTLSPVNAGDNITTSGAGAITSAGLLTGSLGALISGADVRINHDSNFDTYINTGTSTGSVTIGNALSGPIQIYSSAGLTLSGDATTISTSTGKLSFQPSGAGVSDHVHIGEGAILGSATPDTLVLDIGSIGITEPVGINGSMYYSNDFDSFRCFTNGSWGNCDTTGGTATLQSAYNSGATITTAGATNIAFILNSGNFTASGLGAVNLTPDGPSSFTSDGALTLTAGAASTWGTSALSGADLTLQANGGVTNSIKIGTGGSDTPNLLVVDVKNTAGDPALSPDGAMYYSTDFDSFRCHVNGGWQNCGTTAASATTLQQSYVSDNTITTVSGEGDFNVTGSQAVILTPTSASQFTSGGVLTLTGGATSTWGTSAGNLNLQVAGAGTTANVQIGSGVASATPDYLVLDQGTTEPGGTNGAMYYNSVMNKFRCYTGGWTDCLYSVTDLQIAYDNGGSITTSNSNNIAYTLTSGNFTVDGIGSATLNPTGGVNLGSATSAVNLPGLSASSSVFTDASKNLTSSGTVSIAQGGTGQTNKTAAFDALAPIAAKGGLIINNGTDYVALSLGAIDGQILIRDGASATGIKWADNTASPDSLDFIHFDDSMELDANTSINLAGNNFTINDLTGGGVLTMNTNGAALNIGTAGTNALNLGNAGATFALTSSGGLNVTTAGVMTGGTWNGSTIGVAYGGTGLSAIGTGELLYGSAANTYSALAAGTSGQILQSNGAAAPSWVNDPSSTGYLFGYDTTNQAVVGPAGTWQAINFSNPTANSNGWTYNAGNFTCPATGTYQIHYDARAGRSNNGDVAVTIRATQNGNEIAGSVGVTSPARAFPVDLNNSFIVNLTANDLLKFELTSSAIGNSIGLYVVNAYGATQPRITVGITRIK